MSGALPGDLVLRAVICSGALRRMFALILRPTLGGRLNWGLAAPQPPLGVGTSCSSRGAARVGECEDSRGGADDGRTFGGTLYR